MLLAYTLACRPEPDPRPRPPPGSADHTGASGPSAETGAPACAPPPGAWADGTRADARLSVSGYWSGVTAVDPDGDGLPTLAGLHDSEAVVLGGASSGVRDLGPDDVRLAGAHRLATGAWDGADQLVLGGDAVATWAFPGGEAERGAVLRLPPDRGLWSVAAGADALAVGSTWDRSGIDPVYWVTGPLADGELDDVATARIETVQHGAYGHAVGFPGDLTGDGLDDLVVTDLWGLFVFPGGSAGDLSEADAAWRLTGAGFGDPGPRVGDLTGDGVDDLLVQVGPYYGDTVWLVPGGPARRSGDLATRARLTFTARGYLPWVAPIDDLDGDGIDDLVFVREANGPAALVFVRTPPADGRVVEVGGAAVATIDLGIPWPSGSTVHGLLTVDLDGDCVREVVVATIDGLYVFAR